MMRRSRLSRGMKGGKKSRLEKTAFYDKPLLTELDIRKMKMMLNQTFPFKKKVNVHDILAKIPEGGWNITPEQTEKGFNWLMKQWKTPTGYEREKNPFGYREQAVLENFKEFRLTDFFDAVNAYQVQAGIHNYLPIYTVIAKDGSSFQYYNDYQGIHITG